MVWSVRSDAVKSAASVVCAAVDPTETMVMASVLNVPGGSPQIDSSETASPARNSESAVPRVRDIRTRSSHRQIPSECVHRDSHALLLVGQLEPCIEFAIRRARHGEHRGDHRQRDCRRDDQFDERESALARPCQDAFAILAAVNRATDRPWTSVTSTCRIQAPLRLSGSGSIDHRRR